MTLSYKVRRADRRPERLWTRQAAARAHQRKQGGGAARPAAAQCARDRPAPRLALLPDGHVQVRPAPRGRARRRRRAHQRHLPRVEVSKYRRCARREEEELF